MILLETSTRSRSARYFAYVALLTISFVNLLSYADMSASAPTRAHDDALRYLAMSKQTFAPVDNPFALRILSPWLAQNIQRAGLGLNNSWILLTFAATGLALILFFKILYDHFELSLFVSLLSTAMLACTYWYTLFNFGDPWLVDPVNNAAIVAVVYACLERRLGWFAIAVIVGSVNKETMMLFAPLYVLMSWARRAPWRSRDVIGGAVVLVVSGIVFVGFHAWVKSKLPAGRGYAPLSGVGGHSVTDNFRSSVSVMKTEQQFAIFDTYHFLWLFFLYGLYRLRQQNGFRDQTVVLGIYASAACLFGRLFGSDLQRVFAMMAPVVVMVAAVHVFTLFDTEHDRPWIAVFGFVYIAVNLRWVPPNTSVYLDVFTIAVSAVGVSLISGDPRRRPNLDLRHPASGRHSGSRLM